MVFLWYRASLRTAWYTGDPVSRSRRKGGGGGHKRRGCSGFEGVQSFLEEKMQEQECEETQCYFASVGRKPRTDRKRGCWRTKPHGQAPGDCFPPMRLHLLRSHSLPKQCHQLGTKHSNGGGISHANRITRGVAMLEQRKSAGEHQDSFQLQLGDILCLAFPPHSFLLSYVRTGTVIMGRAGRKAGKREMFAQASRTFMRLGDERVRVKCLLSLDC